MNIESLLRGIDDAGQTLVQGAEFVELHVELGDNGSRRLSMLSPGSAELLQRPFEAVPAESLAEVFHLYSEGGARFLRTREVPIVRASEGEVVEDAIVTGKAPGQPVRHLRVNATPMVGLHI